MVLEDVGGCLRIDAEWLVLKDFGGLWMICKARQYTLDQSCLGYELHNASTALLKPPHIRMLVQSTLVITKSTGPGENVR